MLLILIVGVVAIYGIFMLVIRSQYRINANDVEYISIVGDDSGTITDREVIEKYIDRYNHMSGVKYANLNQSIGEK